MKIESTLREASQILKINKIPSYELDAQIILSSIIGVSREFLVTNYKSDISEEINQKYSKAIERRIKREPVAYITGEREFWSKNFLVDKSTLVPRPETELLIYKVVSFFKNKTINILDIGTGSGCILLSILKELKKSVGIGIDICPKAIKIAKKNSNRLNLNSRAKFRAIDMTKFSAGKYDLVISNPPYIPSRDIKNLSKDIINYEPKIALDGGHDGLDLINKVIYKSGSLLKRNGLLVIEIGNDQYSKVSRLLHWNGFKEMFKEYDINRNVRCIMSTKVRFL